MWLECPTLFIEKSRQIMVTWLFVCLYLWDALFHNARRTFLQSKKEEDADELIERARVVYGNLERIEFPELPQVAKTSSGKLGTESEMSFPSMDSKLVSIPQGPDQVRSYTWSGGLADEIAFQKKAYDAYTAAVPSLMGGGRFTAPSTANGKVFNYKMLYGIDPKTDKPLGPPVIDSDLIPHPKYTPDQLMRMTDEQFNAIPLAELVACVPGMRYWVNSNQPDTDFGIHCCRVHLYADPDKSPRTEKGTAYIRQLKASMPDKSAYEREIEINYESYDGQPVIGNFDPDIFVGRCDYDSELSLRLSADYGSIVCGALVAQLVPIQGYNMMQLQILDELILRNSNTDVLAQMLKDLMETRYSRSWEHNNLNFYCDVAGRQGSANAIDPSLNTSIKIMRSYGFAPKSRKIDIYESTELTKTIFSMTSPNGIPAVKIDPRCRYLIKCLKGGWRYPEHPAETRVGYPEKDGEYEHGGDMLRYLIAHSFPGANVKTVVRNYQPSVPVRTAITRRIVGYRHPSPRGRRYVR